MTGRPHARWAPIWLGAWLGCAGSALPPPTPPAQPAPRTVPLCDHTRLVLLDTQTTRTLLGTQDDFVRALSPLDRRLRLGVPRAVDEASFLSFTRAQARDFGPAQVEKLTYVTGQLSKVLCPLGVARWLPDEIRIGQTTGLEEGLPSSFDLSYTRAGTIYLNARALQVLSRQLLAHELFHIISFNHPSLREALYRALGFEAVAHLSFPKAWEARRLSTPEVPRPTHALRATLGGAPVRATPLWSALREDPSGPMVDEVETRWALISPAGEVTALVGRAELLGLREQIGYQPADLPSPEEMLAEHFVTLTVGTSEGPRHEGVLSRMREILGIHQAKP